jgi:hypothetical protein
MSFHILFWAEHFIQRELIQKRQKEQTPQLIIPHDIWQCKSLHILQAEWNRSG